MKTIYKYELDVESWQHIDVPINFMFLSVQVQYGRPCMWLLVDPNESGKYRLDVWTVGTGHPFEYSEDMKFTGTYQLHEGSLVFHVFIR